MFLVSRASSFSGRAVVVHGWVRAGWVLQGGYTGWVLYRVLPQAACTAVPLTSSPAVCLLQPAFGASLGLPWEGCLVSAVGLLEEGHNEGRCAEGPAGPGVPARGPDALLYPV